MMTAPLAGNINIGMGRSEMPTATMTTPGGASATVYINGAHVTSWQTSDGVERLFMSSASGFGPGIAIRGGIPVCFPQFSGRGTLPKHGFARTSGEWEIESMSSDGGVPCLVLKLEDSEATRAVWPHRFTLRYTVRLEEATLSTLVEVTNNGDAPLAFTAALHAYLRVPDVASVRVHVLGGLHYEDNAAGGTSCSEELAPELGIVGEVDRVYLDAPDTLKLATAADSALAVSKTGFRDVVLWNLGELKAPSMADLGAGEWRHYVCLEAGAVGQPVELGPSAVFRASQSFEPL